MLADKLSDVANIAVGAMAFGQAVSERPFNPLLATVGLAIWFAFLAFALFLAREEEQ